MATCDTCGKARIPTGEFHERWKKVQEGVRARGLDCLIVHSNEADYANVRYLTNYWPIFESSGVIVPPEGEPALLIGPESETFARDVSETQKIYKLIAYRESAEPDYPGVAVDTFATVFQKVLGKVPKRIGIASHAIFPLPVWEGIREAAPNAEIVKSDELIVDLRIIKSPAELAVLQDAFCISECALTRTLEEMKVGMTELQVVGVIERELYANGAEYEGHPQYVLAGRNSNHAIGRPGYKVLEAGELIQLNIGARVAGYSSSVGRPVCFGRMSGEMRRLVQAGLDLHLKTMEWMKAGVIARDVVQRFYGYADTLGVRSNVLYGPCHGLGMIEVERPWMELHSDYPLRENMTYQVDTFLYTDTFGLRWENGVAVTADGVRPFSGQLNRILEL